MGKVLGIVRPVVMLPQNCCGSAMVLPRSQCHVATEGAYMKSKGGLKALKSSSSRTGVGANNFQ